MELKMNYQLTKELFNILGKEKFIELFDKNYELNVYSMSTAWLKDKQYILKFKGGSSDLIVTWN